MTLKQFDKMMDAKCARIPGYNWVLARQRPLAVIVIALAIACAFAAWLEHKQGIL